MQAIPVMFDRVTTKADELREQFGWQALSHAEALLNQAAAICDRRTRLFYADVCSELRDEDAGAQPWVPKWPRMRWRFRR